jgi:hypothetical protein
MKMLAPHIERALTHCPPIDDVEPEPVVAYPRQWKEEGASERQVGTKRSLDAAPLWRLHVGQPGQSSAAAVPAGPSPNEAADAG